MVYLGQHLQPTQKQKLDFKIDAIWKPPISQTIVHDDCITKPYLFEVPRQKRV